MGGRGRQTARSSRRRKPWVAISSTRRTTSTPRSILRPGYRLPAWVARSRCVRSLTASTPIEQVFRDEWGRVIAALVGYLGDFDLAEESAQGAFTIAAERWPRDGTPANPRAWLVTTARNRAIDRIRRDRTLAAKLRLLDRQETVEDEMAGTNFPDERQIGRASCRERGTRTE